MVTVVINTVEEQKKWRLDKLFGMQYGKDRVIWFDQTLSEIPDIVVDIEKGVLSVSESGHAEARLIIVLNCDKFFYGEYEEFADIYSDLTKIYIKENLIDRFEKIKAYACSIVFINNTKKKLNTGVARRYKNEIEAMEAAEEAEYATSSEKNGKSELIDTADIPQSTSQNSKVLEKEDYVKKAFEAENITVKNHENYIPKIRLKGEGDENLVLLPPGSPLEIEIRASESGFGDSIVEWLKQYKLGNDFSRIYILNTKYKEKNLICLYFGILEYIDKVITDPEADIDIKTDTSEDDVKKKIRAAYLRYDYFSVEENYKVVFKQICRYDESVIQIARSVRNPSMTGSAVKKVTGKKKIAGYIQTIKNRFDKEAVNKENDNIRRNVIEKYYKERDNTTYETVKQIYELESEELSASDDNVDQIRNIDDLVEEYLKCEKQYKEKRSEYLDKIIKTRIEVEDYEDVRSDLNEIARRYEIYKRKSKFYLATLISAAVSVLLLFLPYPIFCSVNDIVKSELMPFYGITLAAFAALYLISAEIFNLRIRKEETEIYNDLIDLDKRSSEKRDISIKAMEEYYNSLMIFAESLSHWWRETCKRNEQNLKIGKIRNMHIKRFSELKELTLALATAMNLKGIDGNPKREEYDFDLDNIDFKVEKNCTEMPNLNYYRFFGNFDKKGDDTE